MANRVEIKPGALYEIRRSPETQSEIDGLAARMASAAGPGFEWSSQQGAKRPSGRWRAIVYPATWSARQRNATENTLVRVLGSVR
ncbi:hypothetical protein XU06_22935 [Rhodococcus erythropolis]|uniref:hypothetical protein n=1 Tax=Rhodococcus erythropolis TaxID=1833 RepID=UPI00061B7F44|nr:hypothetical protein [Rhodococcus erythropolis]AKD99209.1 hypothetical protein XU06_22935 [Rhodococcus erythropolis]